MLPPNLMSLFCHPDSMAPRRYYLEILSEFRAALLYPGTTALDIPKLGKACLMKKPGVSVALTPA